MRRNKALGGLLEYDEDANEADFVVSTAAPDRDGDTVDQDSIDWSEFDVNPALTLSHDTETAPHGSWLPETRRTVTVKDPTTGEPVKATVMRARFDMNDPDSARIANKVKEGFLRGASISFLPSQDGTQKNRSGGSHYEGAKVTEIAVCNVPANQGASRSVEMVLKSLRRKAPEFGQFFDVKQDGGRGWGVWNRRGNRWENDRRFPDRNSAWNLAENIYHDVQDDEARWGEPVSHSIKFWRHKTDKGRVRCMRKDASCMPDDVKTVEPLDEEPKAEDLVDWAEEEMQEPEHKKAGAKWDITNENDGKVTVQRNGVTMGVFRTGAEAMKYIENHMDDGDYYGTGKSKTDDLADSSAERAMELSDVPPDEAVDAAMEEQDVPKAMRPAVKRLALKRLVAKVVNVRVTSDDGKNWIVVPASRAEGSGPVTPRKFRSKEEAEAYVRDQGYTLKKSKSADGDQDDKDCSEMPGFKYLKEAIDSLEKQRKGIENPDVTRAADKALAALKAGIARAYGKDAYPGDQEEVVENDLEPVQVDGKWTNYDGTTDEYVGEYDTEEAAKRGITEEAREEVPTEKRWKANRKSVVKGLSKATSALLKDQTEVLDDLAGGSDLPKRYKGTVAGVSAALKTLLTKDSPEETLLSKDVEDEEAVMALAKTLDQQAEEFDVAMKRKYGQMWRRDNN